jgi:tetratricopeptide (TPR) repeat protein
MRVLSYANELYLKGGEGTIKGLKLFDREWPNIQAGQASAKEMVNSEEGDLLDESFKSALQLSSSYPNAGVYFLHLRLHALEMIRWLKTAIAATQQLREHKMESVHLGNLGMAYALLGEIHHAIDCYEKYLAIAREIGDRRGEGNALGNLGNAYGDLGETRCAIYYYEKALAIYREIGDKRGKETLFLI